MATLVDVALTAADKKKQIDSYKIDDTSNMDDYPYGLCICLNSDTLTKLGLMDADFESGDPVNLQGIGMIKEDSTTLINGKKRRTLSIQLQKIAIDQTGDVDDSDAAMKLYGGK